jgi:SAM-dependent methyltransferase
MMDTEKLKTEWHKEESHPFSGWDFSHLDGRWEIEPLRWDYKKLILYALKSTDRLLDMGTGGGEFLLGLNHPADLTCATEGYPPNFDLCRKKLSPLGIDVRQIFDDDKIPFGDDLFDIVINRHESFDIKEVRRVLMPGGLFITQQVGGRNSRELSEKLIKDFKPKFLNFDLSNTVKRLRYNGFDIFLSDEQLSSLKFLDVGAVVYFAKVVEWEFPGFSVDACFERLIALQKELEQKGYVHSAEHRFVIVAQSNKG